MYPFTYAPQSTPRKLLGSPPVIFVDLLLWSDIGALVESGTHLFKWKKAHKTWVLVGTWGYTLPFVCWARGLPWSLVLDCHLACLSSSFQLRAYLAMPYPLSRPDSGQTSSYLAFPLIGWRSWCSQLGEGQVSSYTCEACSILSSASWLPPSPLTELTACLVTDPGFEWASLSSASPYLFLFLLDVLAILTWS